MRTTLIAITTTSLGIASCGQPTVQDLWMKAAKEENPERRLVILTEAIELEPNNAEAYFRRGELHAEFVRMLKQFTAEGMRDDDDSDEAHYADALADLTKATELDPKLGMAFLWRGNAHSYMGDLGLACKDWRLAVALGSESPSGVSECH